jgi:hypothetical protein
VTLLRHRAAVAVALTASLPTEPAARVTERFAARGITI